jgi:hypothetical protein
LSILHSRLPVEPRLPVARILYCHCAYARVVPAETKAGVLEGLARADIEFDAVPDLCEMAARRDPRLGELAAGAPLRIAACYPRAVKWLFASAGVNLDGAKAVVFNMRTDPADRVLQRILATPAATDMTNTTEDVSPVDALRASGSDTVPGTLQRP